MLIGNKHQWKASQEGVLSPRFWDLRLQAQIGRDLRRQYEQSMNEPLPERLTALLNRLEEQEHAAGSRPNHDQG